MVSYRKGFRFDILEKRKYSLKTQRNDMRVMSTKYVGTHFGAVTRI